mmetsp:Transcript_35843/g.70511  ORF Transcript_35843/g.70511 Transcript_35843/m.70511 type:complete len:105 (+) Transcript_35843:123-437(+)|eukprot:CAMPEP_0194325286 /NCGR_PEP_ID=MMETSP0171-20130528/29153_1 /TAXON_ID=218684 /ORGANISM="Corethron pennatum, Strain L29A3" /LENGTH=104 /DNA_ID=CAMNT_0039084345 /DNA_START=98 /DNA_END=412 /DNA_ORIENTATION=-
MKFLLFISFLLAFVTESSARINGKGVAFTRDLPAEKVPAEKKPIVSDEELANLMNQETLKANDDYLRMKTEFVMMLRSGVSEEVLEQRKILLLEQRNKVKTLRG